MCACVRVVQNKNLCVHFLHSKNKIYKKKLEYIIKGYLLTFRKLDKVMSKDYMEKKKYNILETLIEEIFIHGSPSKTT